MKELLGLLVVITTICSGQSESTPARTHAPPPDNTPSKPRGVVVVLGGVEEEVIASSIASLLLSRGYDVTVFAYGGDGGGGGGDYPEGTEIVEIPLADEDPIYSPIGGKPRYITPSLKDGNMYDVTSLSATQQPPSTYDAIVTSSRTLACQQLLLNTTWTQQQISRAKIFATPLHLHDLCTLTFARQFDLPVVGVVTSRTGSWWAWHWLDIVPPLATSALPPNIMSSNFGFVERATNIWNYLSYISSMETKWHDPLMATLPPGTLQPIGELYDSIRQVLVAWDWLTDSELPRANFLTSFAGFQWDREEINKETLLSSQRNRNGAVFCNLKLKELWVGMAAQRAILRALAASPFTVVWRGVEEAQEGEEEGYKTGDMRKDSAILNFEEHPPIEALLAHPRHRLLVSMCGESEATAAILFGSPTLCIPVSPDQLLTSRKLSDLGLALVVPARDVTTNQIKDAILQLTSNRSYRSRGRQLAEEYIDQPLSASDRVLHALEKLVRRPWRYKRRQTERLSLLVKSNGDVMAAILLLMTSLVGVAIYVFFVIVRLYLLRERKKNKED